MLNHPQFSAAQISSYEDGAGYFAPHRRSKRRLAAGLITAGRGLAFAAWATLRFSASRSRWVSSEKWHPNQQARIDKDGTFELKVPYADDRELIMDILKYGADCEVVEPQALRDRVIAELRRGLDLYTGAFYEPQGR